MTADIIFFMADVETLIVDAVNVGLLYLGQKERIKTDRYNDFSDIDMSNPGMPEISEDENA